MTDFKNLDTSTEYAVQGYYNLVYSYIPERYRLKYSKEEAVITPREFFDQELTVENRLKYRASCIPTIDRKSPWIAIMWNSEGLQPAENFRRIDLKLQYGGAWHKGKGCFVKLPMVMGIVSNSKTALDEFQETFLLNMRPDDWTITPNHPLLENFTVNVMDFSFSNTTKLTRTDGTLSMTMAQVTLQYPIIGCIDPNTGIIQVINVYMHNFEGADLIDFSVQDLDYNKDKIGE